MWAQSAQYSEFQQPTTVQHYFSQLLNFVIFFYMFDMSTVVSYFAFMILCCLVGVINDDGYRKFAAFIFDKFSICTSNHGSYAHGDGL